MDSSLVPFFCKGLQVISVNGVHHLFFDNGDKSRMNNIGEIEEISIDAFYAAEY